MGFNMLAIPVAFILFASLFGCASQGTGNGGQNQAAAQSPPLVELENQSRLADLAASAKVAASGDIVGVQYVGSFTNGTVFDTNVPSEAKKAGLPEKPSYPLFTFTAGAGQVVPGFDAAVIGMKEGEQKTVTLPPADAYGEKNVTFSVPLGEIGNSSGIKVGGFIQAQNGAPGKVLSIVNGSALVEFYNTSPLAGQTLVFTIKMVSITKV